METGSVKYFNPDKGFGFIKQKDKTTDLFFHITEVQSNREPQDGDKVSYLVAESKKGPCAIKVQINE